MEKQEFMHKRAKLEDVVPRSAPFVIFLDPCGACNFKCNFCPCNVSDYMVAERHKRMDWTLFEKIVDDLQAFDGQVRVINLYAYGEPLLHPRVADMVRILKERHCCDEVRITTNGALLDEKMSRALIASGVDLVRVSVEALSTQGYQELCGVKIEFDKIRNNVETFYKLSRGTKSKITAKIISSTLRSAEDEKRFYEIFRPITDYHFIEEVELRWYEFGEIQIPSGEHVEGLRKCAKEAGQREICTFLFTELCIHSNGIVSACSMDWKFATQYGDVTHERLSDIWNGEKHRGFQLMHLTGRLKKIPYCEACTREFVDKIVDPDLLIEKITRRSGEYI